MSLQGTISCFFPFTSNKRCFYEWFLLFFFRLVFLHSFGLRYKLWHFNATLSLPLDICYLSKCCFHIRANNFAILEVLITEIPSFPIGMMSVENTLELYQTGIERIQSITFCFPNKTCKLAALITSRRFKKWFLMESNCSHEEQNYVH
jgi:hypothetical protein